jgi:hypothetical protein
VGHAADDELAGGGVFRDGEELDGGGFVVRAEDEDLVFEGELAEEDLVAVENGVDAGFAAAIGFEGSVVAIEEDGAMGSEARVHGVDTNAAGAGHEEAEPVVAGGVGIGAEAAEE